MNARCWFALMTLVLGACGDPAAATSSATPEPTTSAPSKPSPSAAPSSPASSNTVPNNSASASASSHASGVSALDRTLAELFAAADRMEVVGVDLRGKPLAETQDKKLIAATLAALGEGQKPTGGLAKCVTPNNLVFFAGDRKLGSVGLCTSAGLDAASKASARVDLPSGETGGLRVADLAALRASLAALKVALP